MTDGIRLIFLGPPGAGKGTQAQVLSEALNIPHISTGEILREAIANQTSLGLEAKSYVDRGELVPDQLILNLIRERLGQPDALQGWILDGFPRNVSQAEFLEHLLEELAQHQGCAINLEVPDRILVERLLLRGRQDDNEETIRRRLQVYREKTAPLIDFYRERGKLHTVKGDRPPSDVSELLKQIVQEGIPAQVD